MAEVSDMSNRTQGQRFNDDWTTEQIHDIVEQRIHAAITIPVKVEIKGNHRVLNLEEARRYLEDAQLIVLMDCTCRLQRQNCDSPLTTCIRLNERGEQAMTSEQLSVLNPREATIEEALNVLDHSHKAGLVHIALAVDREEINEICSCCPCCCLVLSAILRFGSARHILKFTAIAMTDQSKCVGCGICAERCQFGARKMVNDTVVFDPELCSGCGLCVSTCLAQAITLSCR